MSVSFFNQASDIFLEVEVNPDSADTFESKYLDITDQRPVLGSSYQHQRNKWGCEVRVYFNSEPELLDDLASADVHVEQGERPYRSRWSYRINDRDFFWSLIHAGYRLGEN